MGNQQQRRRHLAQELKQLLSRLVVRQAEIVVKRAVVLAGSAMSFYRRARCLERGKKFVAITAVAAAIRPASIPSSARKTDNIREASAQI
jgi:hypothetical protein